MNFNHQFFDKNTALNESVFGQSKANRVKQTHSNTVIEITKPQTEWVEADGIITRQPNLPIGVITADCAPVLFYGDGVIGAAHAGWQGALSGVLDNTINMMNCDIHAIHAFIGPCISQQSYEVSLGFEIPFLQNHAEAERFFISGRTSEKLHFDLAGYCAYRLSLCGVKKIHIDGRDTLTNDNFHSHRGGADATQRNLSAVMMGGI